MKRSYMVLIGILAIILYGVVVYNGIISARNEVERKWADVESNYQRRYDLIPNLAKTVKKYSEYEQETLLKVTEARNRAKSLQVNLDDLNEENLAKYQQAQADLQRSLSGAIDVVVERYPDLKANENFLNLQAELAGTENRINYARNQYNEAVTGYNNKIQRIPGKFIAQRYNFTSKPLYKSDEGTREAPDVEDIL